MTGRPILLLLAGLLCSVVLFPAPAAQGADHIWSGVVLASQVKEAKGPPAELARLAPEIGKVFGCNQLTLLGSATRVADDPAEHWLNPTEHFSLAVKSKRAVDNNYVLQIALYHDKKKLVDTEARLAPDSPFFIRGPMHAKGQLIIVLQVLH